MKHYISTIAISLLLIGCGDKSNSEEAESDSKKSPSNNSVTILNNTCLHQFYGEPGKMIKEQDVVDICGLKDIDYEREEKLLKKKMKKYSMVSFSWDSDRTRVIDIGDNSMTVPVDNSIVYGGARELSFNNGNPKESFKKIYKTLTKEERDNARKAMQAQVDKQKKKADPNYESTSETAIESTQGLLSKTMDKIKYTEVNGVGDLATWESNDRTLFVLVGNWQFTVSIDLSNDEEDNKNKAIALAKKILEQCNR